MGGYLTFNQGLNMSAPFGGDGCFTKANHYAVPK